MPKKNDISGSDTKKCNAHGESRTSLYIRWHSMVSRTTNDKDPSYSQYGGRGITVCEEWKEYKNFRNWALNNGYMPELTLERKDNNKGYSPENCIWADWEIQNNNKQQSRKEEYKGEIKTVKQWAEKYNMNYQTLLKRLNRGMTIEEAIETPVKNGKGSGFKPHINKDYIRQVTKNMIDEINDSRDLMKISKMAHEIWINEIKSKHKK